MQTEELEKELMGIVGKMDIPDYRKRNETIHNYRWMFKNIGFRNSDNKNFGRVMEILEILIKEKK